MTTENDTNESRESLLAQPAPALLDKIREAHEAITALESQRSEINDKISAAYETLTAVGISKKAFKAVRALFKLEEDEQRRLYDLSASVCRKALGMPLQGDLFLDAQVKETTDRAIASVKSKSKEEQEAA